MMIMSENIYGIMRCERRSAEEVEGSSEHNLRTRPTHNADKDLFENNVIHYAESPEELVTALQERLDSVDRKIQDRSPRALEYMVNTSGDKDLSIEEYKEYLDAAEKWIIGRHGEENVLSVIHHYDEKTGPHLHAHVVPIHTLKSGKTSLAADHFMGGKGSLSRLQTEFHEKVSSRFGLERGEIGSQAKHEKPNKYYYENEKQMPEHHPRDLKKIEEQLATIKYQSKRIKELERDVTQKSLAVGKARSKLEYVVRDSIDKFKDIARSEILSMPESKLINESRKYKNAKRSEQQEKQRKNERGGRG
jgi:uncharacterized coiled-coil protein SlyX